MKTTFIVKVNGKVITTSKNKDKALEAFVNAFNRSFAFKHASFVMVEEKENDGKIVIETAVLITALGTPKRK